MKSCVLKTTWFKDSGGIYWVLHIVISWSKINYVGFIFLVFSLNLVVQDYYNNIVSSRWFTGSTTTEGQILIQTKAKTCPSSQWLKQKIYI